MVHSPTRWRIGVDVGGTYTDVIFVDDKGRKIRFDKVPSTPGSARSVADGIGKLIERTGWAAASAGIFVHGSTVATNAYLTRSGARVAFVVTDGFRDVLEIRDQLRPHLYKLAQTKPVAIVPRNRLVEARERIDAFGDVVIPLTDRAVENVIAGLIALEPDAIAVCLAFAHLNDAHERILAKRITEALNGIPVYLSSRVNPEIGEYPRANTTAVAAYVGPVVETYLVDLRSRLEEFGLKAPTLYLRSDGGVATSRAMRENPAQMLLSGPAGGVIAAAHLAQRTGIENVVTFDMGGTSADFSIVVGARPGTVSRRILDGLPVRLPMIDIETISAGGGSVARVDLGGGLRVGPDSAGAEPGPACYGKGGDRATVTDAAVVMGIIDANDFLGGEQPVDAVLAREAVKRHVARPLGLAPEAAAHAIIAIASAQMTRAIRTLSAERGRDIRRFSLLAFGGAGPMCAPFVASSLGMRETLVPLNPGVFAALGMLVGDIRHTLQTPYSHAAESVDAKHLAVRMERMRNELDTLLERDGISAGQRYFRFSADGRCIGQFHELSVPIDVTDSSDWWDPAQFTAAFHRIHHARFGHTDAAAPVELVNLRGEGCGRLPRPELPILADSAGTIPKPADVRPVWLDRESGFAECPVYERDRLLAGHRITGPAIIRQPDSTIVVVNDQDATVMPDGLLRLQTVCPTGQS